MQPVGFADAAFKRIPVDRFAEGARGYGNQYLVGFLGRIGVEHGQHFEGKVIAGFAFVKKQIHYFPAGKSFALAELLGPHGIKLIPWGGGITCA